MIGTPRSEPPPLSGQAVTAKERGCGDRTCTARMPWLSLNESTELDSPHPRASARRLLAVVTQRGILQGAPAVTPTPFSFRCRLHERDTHTRTYIHASACGSGHGGGVVTVYGRSDRAWGKLSVSVPQGEEDRRRFWNLLAAPLGMHDCL